MKVAGKLLESYKIPSLYPRASLAVRCGQCTNDAFLRSSGHGKVRLVVWLSVRFVSLSCRIMNARRVGMRDEGRFDYASQHQVVLNVSVGSVECCGGKELESIGCYFCTR